MSTQGSVQIVKELFAAMGCGDLQGVLALTAEDVEWVIPGVGLSTGKIKAANKAFEDHFVFTMTVRDGKVTHIREYIDTLALARVSGMTASAVAVDGGLT